MAALADAAFDIALERALDPREAVAEYWRLNQALNSSMTPADSHASLSRQKQLLRDCAVLQELEAMFQQNLKLAQRLSDERDEILERIRDTEANGELDGLTAKNQAAALKKLNRLLKLNTDYLLAVQGDCPFTLYLAGQLALGDD